MTKRSRPELWLQPAFGSGKLRIFYPDGKAEYLRNSIYSPSWKTSCYSDRRRYKTLDAVFDAAERYDFSVFQKTRHMIFISYL